MNGNGQADAHAGQVLTWPRPLFSADDLRRHLNGQRELRLLPRTVVTPLAADELRARGVRITWQEAAQRSQEQQSAGWSYAEERADPLVGSAVAALAREQVSLARFALTGKEPAVWAHDVASALQRQECQGSVLFCADPATLCCLANKHAGLRAATVRNAAQATRVRKSLGPNVVAVEMPGPTFFELRLLLRAIVTPAACPSDLARTLQELDGHAHR